MTAPASESRFDALWREHTGIARRVAAVYCRAPEDRRDLIQEISLQAWRAFPRYSPDRGRFSTWLYRIALNVALSWVRRDRRAPLEPADPATLDALPATDPAVQDPRLAQLFACIEKLRPLDRALVLLYLDDHAYAEIAAVLGLSETNVATKLSRIKRVLQGELTQGTSPEGVG